MATVPSNAQFRADTTGVTVEQLGSEQTNARAAFFTMADIADSLEPSTNNTVLGLDAFQSNTTGTLNTAIGYQVLKNSTIASTNVGIGAESLRDNVSGNSNIAVGVAALQQNTTGIENTAIGHISFLFNNSSRNTSLGAYTGYNSRAGDNTYIGYRSGNEAWNGGSNTAVGSESHKSVFNSNAQNNVAVGKNALLAVSNGSNNVALGASAMQNITTGNNNIFIGNAADALGGITGTIVIGSEAQASADNQLVIGSGSYPVGTFTAYTGAAAETWEIIVNGNPVKLMVAP